MKLVSNSIITVPLSFFLIQCTESEKYTARNTLCTKEGCESAARNLSDSTKKQYARFVYNKKLNVLRVVGSKKINNADLRNIIRSSTNVSSAKLRVPHDEEDGENRAKTAAAAFANRYAHHNEDLTLI